MTVLKAVLKAQLHRYQDSIDSASNAPTLAQPARAAKVQIVQGQASMLSDLQGRRHARKIGAAAVQSSTINQQTYLV